MKMLITLDGSKFAESILEQAAALASSAGAEVHLLEVVNPAKGRPTSSESPSVAPHAYAGGSPAGPAPGLRPSAEGAVIPAETGAQAEERLQQEARDYLASVAAQFFPEGVRREVVIGDNPAQEIADYFRREGLDLIAMATHGRTGASRAMLGSVAGELLRSHAVPLFLARPDNLS